MSTSNNNILVFGLGNKGFMYQNTRHNIGFDTLDMLAKTKGIDFHRQKHDSEYTGEFK